MDLATDNGRLDAGIKGAVARGEVERKAARQGAAAKQKAERGLPQWRNAFGNLARPCSALGQGIRARTGCLSAQTG